MRASLVSCLLSTFQLGALSKLHSRGPSMMTKNLPFLAHKNVDILGGKVIVKATQLERLTLTTSVPFRRSDSNTATFSVKFNRKEKKTAIGFSAVQPPVDTYLIPDYYPGGDYISMGGAGFIYPMRNSASRGYKEGDLITVQLDFTAGTIAFSVNGAHVGSSPWPSITSDSSKVEAYPFISCEGGLLDMDIWSGDNR